jgi:hypothetical protein
MADEVMTEQRAVAGAGKESFLAPKASECRGSVRTELLLSVRAGVLAGLAGGLVMALYWMLYAEFVSFGFLLPLRLVAAAALGRSALIGGAPTVVLGLFIHLTVAAVLGMIYAAALRARATGFHAVLGGMIFAVAVLVLGTWLALPVVDPPLRARIPWMPYAWLLSHLFYGALLGLTVPLRGCFRARA